MKKIRLIVINSPLKYRIEGYNKNEAFIPRIGEMILLPKDIAVKEIESKNVRRLLPEEIEQLKEKKAAKGKKSSMKKKAKKDE